MLRTPRTFCKLLQGTLVLLVVFSFVSSHCQSTQFHHGIAWHEDNHSCQEHQVETTTNPSKEIFQAVFGPPSNLVPIHTGPLPSASFFLPKDKIAYIEHKNRQKRFPELWSIRRPFLSDQTFLPYFAPERDA